jgi:hypothetical protein
MIANFLTHWKTTTAGILSFVVNSLTLLTGYLGTSDINNTGTIHVSTKVALGLTITLALCRAWVGLLQKDAGTTPATLPGSSQPVAVPSHETPDDPKAVPTITKAS